MGFLGDVMLCWLTVLVLWCICRALLHLSWRPYSIAKAFRNQGVRGPAYRFLRGSNEEIRSMKREAIKSAMATSSHDVTMRVFPHYLKWSAQYGNIFLFWFGPQPRILINDAEMAKQVLSNKFGFFPKLDAHSDILSLMGKGLVRVEGAEWARHRRIVNPAFTVDKLKMLAAKMVECAESMLQDWQNQVVTAENQRREIEVAEQFQELTVDVISHAVFGSSFAEGKEVFLAQKQLRLLAAASVLDVELPGSRYLPTKKNIHRWKLERRARNALVRIIRGRPEKSKSANNDLLGVMMESSRRNKGQKILSMEEMIDECKTFFFAGHETTSHLLTWTLFLLSTNQTWQERLREEVLRVCGKNPQTPISADMLGDLKLVNMAILETLRLYGPVVQLARKAGEDMRLGKMDVPRGTALVIPLTMIHRSREVWGADAGEFNPLRFANGISRAAAHPSALLAFSVGPRACIGQNFAMMEAKTVVAMILRRFSFSLSPNYVHAPRDNLTLQPQFGLQIVFGPLPIY